MIIDTLDNIKRYRTINPLMDKVVEFLAKTDPRSQGYAHIVAESPYLGF